MIGTVNFPEARRVSAAVPEMVVLTEDPGAIVTVPLIDINVGSKLPN